MTVPPPIRRSDGPRCICDPARWFIRHADCPVHGVPQEDRERAARWLRERGLVK